MYSAGIAYLLWFLSGFGALGLHRYYLGKICTGILWTCTGGLGMVGAIYDFFTLSGQVREANIRQAVYDGMHQHYDGYNRRQNWRTVNDGEVHIVREKESLERTILRLAKENDGILTASDVALAGGIPLADAKKGLDALVATGFAELRVRKSGVLVYTMPEFMSRDDPLEDL
jgi:TM2 domain-containing membrane protein YozV